MVNMTSWVRLWLDMPTDPKWRVIAKRAQRPLSEVIAIFTFMLTNAAANANERGALINWSDEDIGAALDIEHEHVIAIREAMQGKVLDGDHLRGWEKRQPKREDNSSERGREWRERSRERKRTQANAEKPPDADADAESDTESKKKEVVGRDSTSESSPLPPEENRHSVKMPAIKGKRLSQEWDLPRPWGEWAMAQGMSREAVIRECDKFKDFWISKSGPNATKVDWQATWRNWIRRHLEEYGK